MLEGYSNIMKRQSVSSLACSLLGMALLLSSGCAAFRPIPGVPARYLSPELRAESRADESTIDLSLLAQNPPKQHYVDGGDVLGIYIEGVLGNPGEAPPITVPLTPDLPPAIGYPITVRDDGTLSLPMIGSVPVRGLTIRQVEEKLRHIYTVDKKILRPGQDRIIVSLQRPRQVRVLVLRQETGGPGGTEFAQGLSINLGQTKRGNGQAVDLPIYKNDVLHALAKTGGLPGLDAENTIYIIRRQQPDSYNCPPGQLPQHVPGPAGWNGQPMPAPAVQPPHMSQANSGNGFQLVGYEEPQRERPSHIMQAGAEQPAPPQLNVSPATYSGGQDAFVANRNYTIERVEARSFGARNPLDELRGQSAPHVHEPVHGLPVNTVSVEQELFGHSNYHQPQMTPPLQSAPLQSTPLHSSPMQQGPPSQQAAPPQKLTPTPEPMFQPQHPQQPQQYAQPGQVAPQPMSNGYRNALPQGQPGMGPAFQLPPQPSPPQPYHADIHRLPPELQGMLNGQADWLPEEHQPWFDNGDPTMNNPHVIKIPVRLKPGQQPHIRPSDVILQDGDIVFIESRETEIFYTGGLLGGGQYTLPRDYDLDVLGAIAVAQGANQQQAGRQIGGVSAINGDVTISASNVIILRMLPNGTQVPIKVDLYRAIRDPAERVIIQPGDIVMLRYKPMEAVGAFIERNLLESALFGLAASSLPSGN